MAWRVSCAVLWAAAIDEKPTAKASVRPTKTRASPAAARCETLSGEKTVRAVMTPSVRPMVPGKKVRRLRVAGLLTCGSQGSDGLPGCPVAKCCRNPRRSQLRGQSRSWPRLGRPHRVPCSALDRPVFGHHTRYLVAGGGAVRQLPGAAPASRNDTPRLAPLTRWQGFGSSQATRS